MVAIGCRPRSRSVVEPLRRGSPSLLDQVAVHRHRRRTELAREAEERVQPGAFRQLLPLLHRNPAPPDQRLDRLHAADVRARQDPIEAVAREDLHQALGLPGSAGVERPQPVVTLPALPVARARVPNEEQPLDTVVAEGRGDRRVAPVRQHVRRRPADLVHLLPADELAAERTHREVADVLAPPLLVQVARVRELPADLAAVARLLLDLAKRAFLRALVRKPLALRQAPVVVAGAVDDEDLDLAAALARDEAARSANLGRAQSFEPARSSLRRTQGNASRAARRRSRCRSTSRPATRAVAVVSRGRTRPRT
jgi:hypothetical protein